MNAMRTTSTSMGWSIAEITLHAGVNELSNLILLLAATEFLEILSIVTLLV